MYKILTPMSLIVFSQVAQAMPFADYIDTVKKENLGYKEGSVKVEGSTLSRNEAKLLTAPTFFVQTQHNFDTKLGTPPMKIYDRHESTNLSAGISQQFNFGLQTKLSYSAVKQSYDGSDFNPDRFWDFTPNIELVMPLWGNGFGSSVKAQESLTKSQNDAEKYAELANLQGIIVNAEVTYWQLAAAQEKVKIQEQALTSAKSIYQYVASQRNKNLGESADVLQASALVEAYTLQLQQAKNEKQRLERAFNKLLNRDTSTTVSDLEKISYQTLENFDVPTKRPGEKYDIKIKKSEVELTKASSILAEERNKPKLDVMGGYSLQGRNPEVDRAFENSMKTRHDSGYVGLMFSVPLDFDSTNDVRVGAKRKSEAAQIGLTHALYIQDEEWSDLRQRMEEAKLNLKLTRAMEIAQKAKLDNERLRLRQGRATTYQVLLFEQDFSQAQASRVLAASELIALKSQLKLYHGEN